MVGVARVLLFLALAWPLAAFGGVYRLGDRPLSDHLRAARADAGGRDATDRLGGPMARPVPGLSGRRRLATIVATPRNRSHDDLARDTHGHRGGTAARPGHHVGQCLGRATVHAVGGRRADRERAAVSVGVRHVPAGRRAVVDQGGRLAGHRVRDTRSRPGGLWQRRRLLVVGTVRRRPRTVRHVHQPQPLRDLGHHGHPRLLRLCHRPAICVGDR